MSRPHNSGASKNVRFSIGRAGPSGTFRAGASISEANYRRSNVERYKKWQTDAEQLIRVCCPAADERTISSVGEKIVRMLIQVWKSGDIIS
jgi:hypothetical protein